MANGCQSVTCNAQSVDLQAFSLSSLAVQWSDHDLRQIIQVVCVKIISLQRSQCSATQSGSFDRALDERVALMVSVGAYVFHTSYVKRREE